MKNWCMPRVINKGSSFLHPGVVLSGGGAVSQPDVSHALSAVFVILSLSLLCACSFWEPFSNSLP